MKRKKNLAYTTLKTTLHTVLKKQDHTTVINEIVSKVNYLRCHMLQFSKLYFLQLQNNNLPFPIIDREFFQGVINSIVNCTVKARNAETIKLYESLKRFHLETYGTLRDANEKQLNVSGLRSVVRYMITDAITDFENNIKMRHYSHLKKYISCLYEHQEFIAFIKRIEKDPKKRKQLIAIKTKYINKTLNSIHSLTQSTNVYHIDITTNSINFQLQIDVTKILPKKLFEKSLAYDIKSTPQDYFSGMLYMSAFVQKHEHKSLSVFPLKTSLIPGHVRLDTETLISVLVHDAKSKKLFKSSIEMYKDYIWSLFFRTDKGIFKSNTYKFQGSIQTEWFQCEYFDGYGS